MLKKTFLYLPPDPEPHLALMVVVVKLCIVHIPLYFLPSLPPEYLCSQIHPDSHLQTSSFYCVKEEHLFMCPMVVRFSPPPGTDFLSEVDKGKNKVEGEVTLSTIWAAHDSTTEREQLNTASSCKITQLTFQFFNINPNLTVLKCLC